MKKSFLFFASACTMLLCGACNEEPGSETPDVSAQKGVNLVANWVGDGKLSPDAVGWQSTAQSEIPWGKEMDGAGCRFRTPGNTLDDAYFYESGKRYESTELMLRFDGNPYEGSAYGFETSEALIAGQTYEVSFDYHVGNGGIKNLTAAMTTSMEYTETKGTSQDGKGSEINVHTLTDVVTTETFQTLEDNATWKTANFSFKAAEGVKHFITFKGDRDWFGIGNLKIEIQ